MNKYLIISIFVALLAGAGWLYTGQTKDAKVTVYKSPQCQCCTKWVDHLKEHGYQVDVETTFDLKPVKKEHGVTRKLSSCHTAVVEGYTIEGHVPADVITRLLEKKPDIRGLAVPGMPVGSPGMERPNQPDQPYQVLAFDENGRITVYAER